MMDSVLGAGLVVLGFIMLWVRSNPDRDRASQAIYRVYQKTTHGVSVDTYFLTGAITLVAVGLALMLGIAR